MRNVLKFKIDENLPIEIVEGFREKNFDASTVEEQGLNGSTDLNIAAVCKKEERIEINELKTIRQFS